jgi:hypothetical protein
MTAWTDFVKQFAKENNISYKQAMTDAKQHYKQHKEKPCPKGHAVCSCGSSIKYKKVKLNIIEDEPISRPTIEPPEPQTRELTETKDYKLQFAKKRRRLTKKQQRKKPPSYPPTIMEGQPKKKKLIFPTPYRKVKLNIIEDAAVELPKIEPPPVKTRKLTETIESKEEPIPQKVRKLRKVKLNIIEDKPTIPSSQYKNIIEEWDTVNLPYILLQEQLKIYDSIENKILRLAKKKSSVIIPDLLFFIKPFLNDLFVHYGSNKTALDIIQNGMVYLVTQMGYDEDKIFKDNTEYIGKHFNKANKKIIYDILK